MILSSLFPFTSGPLSQCAEPNRTPSIGPRNCHLSLVSPVRTLVATLFLVFLNENHLNTRTKG